MRLNKSTSWYFIFLCLLSNLCSAQSSRFSIEHFSKEDGLIDHRILIGRLHSDGLMWLGTAKGLHFFDGYKMYSVNAPTKENPRNGFPQDFVHKMYELENGLLLLETCETFTYENVAYYLFDVNNYKNQRIYEENIRENQVIINADTINLKPNHLTQQNHIYKDPIGNSLTLERTSDEKLKLLLKLTNHEELIFEGLNAPQSHITSVLANDFSKLIFLCTHNGLIKIKILSSPFNTLLKSDIAQWDYGSSIRAISTFQNNQVIVAPEWLPVSIIDKTTEENLSEWIFDYSFADSTDLSSIRNFIWADSSTVWFHGTNSSLLYQLSMKPRRFEYYQDPVIYKILYSVMIDKDRMLLAVTSEYKSTQVSMICFNTKTLSFEDKIKYEGIEYFEDSKVTSVFCKTKNKHIWYANTKGLYNLGPTGEKILGYYNSKSNTDSNDKLSFPVYNLLSGDIVIALFVDRNDKIWIGLESGGINILDPETNSIKTLDISTGLSDLNVCGFLEDDKGMWISTYNGLNYFDYSSESCRSYFVDQGLSHDEFNRYSMHLSEAGTFYFGGMNGITYFNSDSVLEKDKALELFPVHFSFNNKRDNLLYDQHSGFNQFEEITIPATNRYCRFSFSTNDLRNTDKIVYQYKIDSEDDTGNPVWKNFNNSRSLQFDFIPSGKHNIDVRAISVDGRFSNTYSLKLNVEEYFYKTSWFYLSISLILGLIFYMLSRFRINQIKKMEQLKTQLSTDLHDEVGTVLSGVAYRMDYLENLVDEKNKSMVKKIAESSRQAMTSMRDVVWAIDTSSGSFDSLIDRMKEFTDEVLNPLGITYIYEVSDQQEQKELNTQVKHSLLLIFKEFITNTIKHSEATQIKIGIHRTKNQINMILADNGKGMNDSENKSTGIGLKSMRSRVDKLKGKINFINNHGLTANISIPN